MPKKGKSPKTRSSKIVVAKQTTKRVNGPTAVSTRIVSQTQQSIRIKHSERFAEVTFSAYDQIRSYPFNIGGAPVIWASKIGKLFECYRINELYFTFHSYRPTSDAGAVHLAFEYDPNDEDPLSAQALEMYSSYARCSVWDSVELRVNPKQMYTDKYYTRSSYELPPDMRFTDPGRVILANGASPLGTVLGVLRVHYDITFINPQWPVNESATGTIKVTRTTPTTTVNAPFSVAGGVLEVLKHPTLDLEVSTSGTVDSIKIDGPPGLYEVEINGTGTAWTATGLTAGAGAYDLVPVDGWAWSAGAYKVYQFVKKAWDEYSTLTFNNAATDLSSFVARIRKIADTANQFKTVADYTLI